MNRGETILNGRGVPFPFIDADLEPYEKDATATATAKENKEEVLSNGLTREYMVDRMVMDDINSITESMYQDDVSFLDSVLRGDGWIPYNHIHDDAIVLEYESR